jgi:hypothetical protein
MNFDKQHRQTIGAMEAQPHPVLVPSFVTDLRQQHEEEIREYQEKVEKRIQEVCISYTGTYDNVNCICF